jgi:hypothetical protein
MNELNLKIGTNRKRVKITETDMRAVGEGNPNKRFFIYTQSDDGAEYKVNEVWIRDHTDQIAVKGLWVNFDATGTQLLSTSLLAKFLKFMNVSGTQELVGKELILEPKENGFMAIVAYDGATL